jgi:hypothetical protein
MHSLPKVQYVYLLCEPPFVDILHICLINIKMRIQTYFTNRIFIVIPINNIKLNDFKVGITNTIITKKIKINDIKVLKIYQNIKVDVQTN